MNGHASFIIFTIPEAVIRRRIYIILVGRRYFDAVADGRRFRCGRENPVRNRHMIQIRSNAMFQPSPTADTDVSKVAGLIIGVAEAERGRSIGLVEEVEYVRGVEERCREAW